MDVNSPLIVVLGTGGTIAGTGSGPGDLSYQAAQLSVAQLVCAVPALADVPLQTLQVAQIDSKDMEWHVWQALAAELATQLARPEVGAVVVTHGTDTLEETAYLLHRLLDADKPLVLTAAMRPATSSQADGPRNLRDAVLVAREGAREGRKGVVAVMGGKVWPGHALRKVHSWHIDAFDGGESGPLGRISEAGVISDTVPWPKPGSGGLSWLARTAAPRVEIITSHAGADGHIVRALLASDPSDTPLKGLVVAGTGHGTVHQGLALALEDAAKQGVVVWRSTRVARGGVQGRERERWPAAGDLTPAQSRIALMLSLLGLPAHLAG